MDIEESVKPIINMNNDVLNKGMVRDNKQLIAWDCVQTCDTEICPIGNTCVYVKKIGDKCSLQLTYLQALTDMVFSTYRYLNDDALFKIGMHIIPLYSQLCRQKIVEKSVVSLTYLDTKGNIKIHPIYKEIRETMKILTVMWKDLGIYAVPNPDTPSIGKSGFGDSGHYEAISANADNKRNIIR
jgi:hypothetical protein